MSLSRDILQGNLENIKRRINLGSSVNDFDPYGYTPLIMALMTNQIDIVKLLVSKGADVNRPDIFGQPPLHWAIKLEYLDICQYLIEKGAFTNTVSNYGEPILVYPLLKKNFDLIDLLVNAGSSKIAAEDYIFTKYIGHHFELQGYGCFKNYTNIMALVDYQGFRLEFSLHQLYRQFEAYASISQDAIYSISTKDLLLILQRAVKLRQIKKIFPSDQEKEFEKYIHDFNLIPMAFDGHAVSIAFSKNFIVTSDRALNRQETVVFYKLQKPLSIEEIGHFLYGKKSQEFWKNLPSSNLWKKVGSLSIPYQKTGNCSWANIETFPILIEGLKKLEMNHHIDRERLLFQFQKWVDWSQSMLLKQAALKIQQLSGDRKLALGKTLLDVVIQSKNQSNTLEDLSNIFQQPDLKIFFSNLIDYMSAHSSDFQDEALRLQKNFKKRFSI